MLLSFGGKSEIFTSQGLREVTARANIGVKRMGELDTKPFTTATKRKFPKEEAAKKAMVLCSQWEEYLRDPSWHPFKIIVDEGGNSKVYLYLTMENSFEHFFKHATWPPQFLLLLAITSLILS